MCHTMTSSFLTRLVQDPESVVPGVDELAHGQQRGVAVAHPGHLKKGENDKNKTWPLSLFLPPRWTAKKLFFFSALGR